MNKIAIVVFCMGLVACSKPSSDGAAPSASGSAAAAASAAPSSSTTTASASAKYTGSYTATAGTMYVPDGGEWSGTKWRGDDAGDGLGDGTLTLTVTGSHVDGFLEGVLGPAVLDGSLYGDHLTARIDPKDATGTSGFTGTFDGTLKDGVVEGEMRLTSLVTARLLRQAKVTLKKGS